MIATVWMTSCAATAADCDLRDRLRHARVAQPAPLLQTWAGVLVFLILGIYPMVLLLTWGVAIYLTWIETREQKMDWRHKLWWIQLTFLTHFPGYLALRFWVYFRRHRVTA